MLRAILTLCTLGAVALAGCADSGSEGATGDNVHDHSDHDHDQTVSLGNATLEADVLNGTAPLRVNFTLDAGGADANTTWSLDFGDGNATNGTGLPAATAHTYNVTGNLTAVFTVTRGNETTASQITVRVLPGGPAPGAFLREDVFEESGLLVTGVQWCGLQEGVDKATHSWDLVDVEENGTASTVSHVHVLLELEGEANLDLDIAFFDPDGNVLGEGTAFNVLDGPTEEFEVDGPLAAGTYTFEVVSCSGAAQEYTLTATGTYVAA